MRKALDLTAFNKLPNKRKYRLLDDYGIHLEVYCMKGGHQLALFYLYDFYVEVWFNQATDDLDKAIAFDDYKKLDQYLPAIDLTSIYALL